ncbi:MAG: hypothetical protein JW861_06535 [Bacteroidales bacterium]|nr:hypothetical protein [Bacteroidales bacterium]
MSQIRYFSITVAFVLLSCSLRSQPEAIARLDTNAMLVGDQVELTLSFLASAGWEVEWPDFHDTITAHIEIISKTRVDSTQLESGTQVYMRQMFRITSFDSGYYVIPPFRFAYRRPGDTGYMTAESDPLLLSVYSLPVSTEEAFRDIKGPLGAPFTFREALPWIIVFLILLAGGYLAFYLIRKRKQSKPAFKLFTRPELPPHIQALEALDKLREKKLWQTGLYKEYHSSLTEILRVYLFRKFNIHALEMTSGEIMEHLVQSSLTEEYTKSMEGILWLADMVKFAREEPLPDENEQSLDLATAFVKATASLNGETHSGGEGAIVIHNDTAAMTADTGGEKKEISEEGEGHVV